MIVSLPIETCEPRPATPRIVSYATAALLLLIFGTAPAWSQEWGLYLAFDDLVSIDFPGEPKIAKSTYKTENGITLPARVYTAKDEFGTYSLTAVDWSTAEAQHAAAYKACQAKTGDLRGGENPAICGNWARNDKGGATLHAASTYIRSGSKVTHFAQAPVDGVEGVGIQLLNSDRSQTFVSILWHEGFLYIAEATAPQGAPAPNAFPISIQFIDKEGRRIQYAGPARYTPLHPAPPRRR
jgi:hypothetical protein